MFIAQTKFEPVGEFGSIYQTQKLATTDACTYLLKFNIWLLTSSFDIIETNIAERQVKLGGCPESGNVRLIYRGKINNNITYILLYTCDFTCCSFGLLFDSDDGGNRFLRNIDELLRD
jgi:hypothetical protein